VPRKLAEEAMRKERAHPSDASVASPWPLDTWPDVPTKFVLCTKDRFIAADFLRQVVAERLNIIPDEIAAGHCVARKSWRKSWSATRPRLGAAPQPLRRSDGERPAT
jgi:hypothetical protein